MDKLTLIVSLENCGKPITLVHTRASAPGAPYALHTAHVIEWLESRPFSLMDHIIKLEHVDHVVPRGRSHKPYCHHCDEELPDGSPDVHRPVRSAAY